jgi:hypothetical protein
MAFGVERVRKRLLKWMPLLADVEPVKTRLWNRVSTIDPLPLGFTLVAAALVVLLCFLVAGLPR